MTIVRRPSPFGELLSLRQAMDRLFEDSFVSPRSWGTLAPERRGLPLDITSLDDALVVEAQLPGVKPDDVDITLTGDTLTISGRTKSEREQRVEGSALVQEIRRGSFSRTVTLPQGLQGDKADATFENGVLTLHIPKAPEIRPHQIKITATSNGHEPAATSELGSGAR